MIKDIMFQLIDKKGFFINLLLEHLQISLISIFIATIIGLLLGILISEYEKSSKLVLGIINFIYTIPSISLLGFLIPLSGIGNTTAIIALTIYALLPMVRNTHTGITNVDKKVLEAAEGMGSTNFQILYKIKLPLAMPVILTGLRSMATMTIALAGIASFIGAGGLGVAIYRGITTNNTALTIAGSLLIAILAIVVDFILSILTRGLKNNRKNNNLKWIALVLILIMFIPLVGRMFTKKGYSKVINIATKPMTEQYIIGSMLKQIIENGTDLEVNITQGVGGGTSNIMPGMENKEFDMYPEYTSTGWNMVLKREGVYDESMYEELKKDYLEKYNFVWEGIFGFNDSYGLAVRKEIADKYNLKTYSDLARVSNDLTFGAEYDFYERPDGYDSFVDTYGFKFKNTIDLDIGLKYSAINEGKVDVMNIFTTDGQLSVSDVVVLEDNKQFFSSAMAVMVIRAEVLEEYPELNKVLNDIEGILDDSTMAYLNYQVETEGKSPEDVAREYILDKGIIE
ncbi:ABC transporter permease/substrate-binding protein [Clostridium nigeriense]|uniref:ABC transporter permease/substrate-binding protein n=2 Tax=Clostridium TaxID=1485 RepID=UPI0008310627|nr:glycine betaine ABC transporter substrate-binding protein [Clostridium nigeriense]